MTEFLILTKITFIYTKYKGVSIQKKSLKNGRIALKLLSKRGNGLIRTSEAIEAGVQSRTLAELVDAGVLQKLSRGLYRLSELPQVSDPDLVTIAMRIPHGVVTLVSALVFHELTLEVGIGRTKLSLF